MSRYSQYAPREMSRGWASRLDGRVKVVALTVLSAAVWSVDTFTGLGVVALLVGAWLAVSGGAAGKVLAGLRRLWTVLAFVALYYLWAVYSLEGGFGWEALPEVLLRSFLLCGKLALLVAAALWLYFSTPPMMVVDSLTALLRPLERLRVPVGELGFIVGLVIRAFPQALARIRQLWANFRSQGRLAGGDENRIARFARIVRAVVDTMVCYMHYTLHEAEMLSLSLLARGYDPFRPPPPGAGTAISAVDWLFCVLSSAAIILTAWLL